MRLSDELEARFPVLAERAKTSRVSAIKLFCIECMGGNRAEARSCAETDCFLHSHAWNRGRPARMAVSGSPRASEGQGEESAGSATCSPDAGARGVRQ